MLYPTSSWMTQGELSWSVTFVFTPMSPPIRCTTVKFALALRSSTFGSFVLFRFGLGTRSTTRPYLMEEVMPETDVVEIVQFDWPKSLPNVSWNPSRRIVTWTDRSGSQLTHVGDGVVIHTVYGVPGIGQFWKQPGMLLAPNSRTSNAI